MRHDTVTNIKQLQSAVRRKAYEFKYSYKKLMQIYQGFSGKADGCLGNRDSLPELRLLISGVVEDRDVLYEKLLIPADIFKGL